jgi:hypothetical protein
MQNQVHSHPQQFPIIPPKDVVLSLKVTGDRDTILNLLDKMIHVEGFSVLEGSFVVNPQEHTTR